MCIFKNHSFSWWLLKYIEHYSIFSIVKESLVDLSRQLQEALAKESLVQKSKSVHSKITTEQLKTMTEHFRYAKTASQINISSFSDF